MSLYYDLRREEAALLMVADLQERCGIKHLHTRQGQQAAVSAFAPGSGGDRHDRNDDDVPSFSATLDFQQDCVKAIMLCGRLTSITLVAD